jgi:aspartate-semialdehyde dehydrogenase
MNKLRVGILGATGLVGQHYVRLLQDHPLFTLSFLTASNESVGKSYETALKDKGQGIEFVPDLFVNGIGEIERAQELCDFVFSALSSEVAATYETRYAAAGLPVISSASHHRMEEDVPLLIPEVNPDHLEIIPIQKKKRGWDEGFLLAKPNCSLQSYLIPLFPLHREFGIKKLIVTTMQALSGAGHPGVSSLDILDNVIPYIRGEEEKSEQEPLKIMGKIQKDRIAPIEDVKISAHCNRVPVRDGHMACVSVAFKHKPKEQELIELWQHYRGLPQELRLPSAPIRPIIYRTERDRPQPRLDREAESGMAVTVGRLRSCSVLDFRFVALSHNALRGAAAGGLLNAELLVAKGYLSRRVIYSQKFHFKNQQGIGHREIL